MQHSIIVFWHQKFDLSFQTIEYEKFNVAAEYINKEDFMKEVIFTLLINMITVPLIVIYISVNHLTETSKSIE